MCGFCHHTRVTLPSTSPVKLASNSVAKAWCATARPPIVASAMSAAQRAALRTVRRLRLPTFIVRPPVRLWPRASVAYEPAGVHRVAAVCPAGRGVARRSRVAFSATTVRGNGARRQERAQRDPSQGVDHMTERPQAAPRLVAAAALVLVLGPCGALRAQPGPQPHVMMPTAGAPLTLDAGARRSRWCSSPAVSSAPWDIELPARHGMTALVTESNGASAASSRRACSSPSRSGNRRRRRATTCCTASSIHPDFARNHLVYVSYLKGDDKKQTLAHFARPARRAASSTTSRRSSSPTRGRTRAWRIAGRMHVRARQDAVRRSRRPRPPLLPSRRTTTASGCSRRACKATSARSCASPTTAAFRRTIPFVGPQGRTAGDLQLRSSQRVRVRVSIPTPVSSGSSRSARWAATRSTS